MYRYKLHEDHIKSLNDYKYVIGSEDEPKDNTQNDDTKKGIEIVLLTLLLCIAVIVTNDTVFGGILLMVLFFYSIRMLFTLVVIDINKYLDEIDDRVVQDEVVQGEVVQGKVFTTVNTKGNRHQVIARSKHNKRVRVTGNYRKKSRKIQSHTRKKVVRNIVVFDRHP